MEDSTYLSQSKYARKNVKRIGMKNVNHKRIPAPTHLKLSKKISGENVSQSLCKSSFEGFFILRNNPSSWVSKKQKCVFMYNVAAGSNCSQMIWMKQMLTEYNVIQDVMTLYCDIFTKILEASQFEMLRGKLGICPYEEL